ncbi:MAG: patatin-like phospholipase family protein [Gemmatimonadota bacterium]|nr:patatin-like phospholipase family protein [Gemmatimonadota bacterium]
MSDTTATHVPHGAPRDGGGGEGLRRSLILAGGGMRVAYQAGVIRALLEHGLTFAHADGTSGGTINLAMLLSGLSPDEMCDRWRTLRVRDFVSFVPWHEYLRATDMLAWGDADGIRGKVFPHLGIDPERIRAARGMNGTFNVCNFTRKANEAIPHERIDLDFLVAGISLPMFMPPVPKGNALYLDSVWIKDANCMEAVRRGADELWLVWCIGNTPKYRSGVFNQYVHMIELSANGVLFEEFDRIAEINERVLAGEHPGGRTRPIVLHVIKPSTPLPLDPDLYFGRITTASLIDMGYADASAYLRTMRPEGLPFTPEATSMSDARPGITFRETMAGAFALGETDPELGVARGKADGTELSMHATITIDDMERFVADANHVGAIDGRIDFAPMGAGIPARAGQFNLFSPTGDPKHKRMVYELAFTHDGQEYYLAGRKEVHDDPGFDMWRDTTTLYTRLHRGDASGPVVGAGILSLGAAELLKLVRSMSVTNADSMTDKAETVGQFGRFFLGELWGSYAKMVG